jgi:HAD superfamily hydrolase (TIGR01549 family)
MKNMSVAKPFFVLAPMDDVTDTVFRQVVRDMAAPDLFFTEFVNVDGLMSPGRPNLLKKLRFAEKEGKVVAQLWGLDPDNFRAIAAQIADGSLARELGLPDGVNFAGVDLNMGCPAKSEVKNGACAALIRPESRPLAEQIIAATREGLMGSADLRMPLSVKTRTGFSAVDMTWFDFLLHQNLDMLTVHGRTRKQMSKVSADWELIGRVREMRDELGVHTLIVGNGDVMSREQGEALAAQYKLDGIMIGRGIFHDPYIFHQDGPGEWEGLNEATRINLYRKHVELFAATWKHGERPIHTLNKFCKMYIQGFDGASALRAALMTAPDAATLVYLLDNHLRSMSYENTVGVLDEVATDVDVPYDEAMNTTIKAIVFDSDGTLVDTRELIYKGYKTVLERHGMDHLGAEHYIRQRLGKPIYETYEQILAGHHTDLNIHDLVREHDEVQNALTHVIKPYPHTKEILEEWHSRGVKICLFTSGSLMMVHRNFGAAGIDNVDELFDAIITADDDISRKPEPDAILELLRRVEVEPSNAVVVGDHAYDMIAAGRARVGLKVGILHGVGTQHELLTAGADFLTNDLESLNHLMNFATK